VLKLLLIYWQPKDIPECINGIESLQNVDKLTIQYCGYPEPHKIQQEFLATADYDYIIMVTNDLIVEQKNLDTLIADINQHHHKIISGVCNADLDKYKNFWNVTRKEPVDNKYRWVEMGTMQGIQPVAFAGFPLMAISREVYKQFNWCVNGNNAAMDKRFCHWANNMGYQIMVNPQNEMKHLHQQGDMMVGIKPKKVIYERYV